MEFIFERRHTIKLCVPVRHLSLKGNGAAAHNAKINGYEEVLGKEKSLDR